MPLLWHPCSLLQLMSQNLPKQLFWLGSFFVLIFQFSKMPPIEWGTFNGWHFGSKICNPKPLNMLWNLLVFRFWRSLGGKQCRATQLPELQQWRTFCGALWKMSRIFHELSCGHSCGIFPGNLQDEFLVKKVSPKTRLIFASLLRKHFATASLLGLTGLNNILLLSLPPVPTWPRQARSATELQLSFSHPYLQARSTTQPAQIVSKLKNRKRQCVHKMFCSRFWCPLTPPLPKQRSDGFPVEFLWEGPQTELRTNPLRKLRTNRITNKRA